MDDFSNLPSEDIFMHNGPLRLEFFDPHMQDVLTATIQMARETRWEAVRTPHIFMGLLAKPDEVVRDWAHRLQASLTELLDQFRTWFTQETGISEPIIRLHREFLSDNALRLLRQSRLRALEDYREIIIPSDVLLQILTTDQNIVVECFSRIGMDVDNLAEQAQLAKQAHHDFEADS